jgi:hypothetical protein
MDGRGRGHHEIVKPHLFAGVSGGARWLVRPLADRVFATLSASDSPCGTGRSQLRFLHPGPTIAGRPTHARERPGPPVKWLNRSGGSPWRTPHPLAGLKPSTSAALEKTRRRAAFTRATPAKTSNTGAGCARWTSLIARPDATAALTGWTPQTLGPGTELRESRHRPATRRFPPHRVRAQPMAAVVMRRLPPNPANLGWSAPGSGGDAVRFQLAVSPAGHQLCNTPISQVPAARSAVFR